MITNYSIVLATAIVCSFIQSASCQEFDVGQRVMPKEDCKAVDDNGKPIDLESWTLPFEIQRVEKGRLLVGDFKKGWVQTDSVLSPKDATDYYTERINLKPGSSAANYRRGLAWDAQGQFEKAKSDFDRAISIDPKVARYFNSRAIWWMRKRDTNRAEADLNEAIRLDPKFARAYVTRAVLKSISQEGEALRDLDKAIELDPNLYSGFYERGMIRLYTSSKPNYAKAIADFTEAIRLNPLAREAYEARGSAWEKVNEPSKAKADRRKVEEILSQLKPTK
jgi:tetratricopeptide (TPR) repeat protein